MASPTNTTLLDSFTRSNASVDSGGPSGLWGVTGTDGGPDTTTQNLLVVSNTLSVGASGNNGATRATYGPNLDIFFTVSAWATGTPYIAVWLALASAHTSSFSGPALLLALSATNSWAIQDYNPSSAIASATATPPAAGDKVWINRTGQVVTVYVARSATPTTWTQVVQGTSAVTATTGPIGIELGNQTNGNLNFPRLDDLSGGTVTSSGTTDVMTLAAGSVARGISPTVIVLGTGYGALGRGNAASAVALSTIAGALGRGISPTDFAIDLAAIGGAVARGNAAISVAIAALGGAVARGPAPVAIAQAGFAGALGRGTLVTGAYSPVANRGAIAKGFVTGLFAPSIDLPVTLGLETRTTSIGIESRTRTIGVEDHSTSIGIESHTTTLGIDG